jgi:hypothetical protein
MTQQDSKDLWEEGERMHPRTVRAEGGSAPGSSCAARLHAPAMICTVALGEL